MVLGATDSLELVDEDTLKVAQMPLFKLTWVNQIQGLGLSIPYDLFTPEDIILMSEINNAMNKARRSKSGKK